MNLQDKIEKEAEERYPPDVDNIGFTEEGREILRDGNQEDRELFLEGATYALELLPKWVNIGDAGMPEEQLCCLWCRYPIVEPPYVGNEISSDWTPDYYTHYMVLE